MNAKKHGNEQAVERVLTTWGIVVILWSLYRAYIPAPLWFNEFIAKPLIFLTPVYLFFKQSVHAHLSFLKFLGFPEKKDFGKELLFSVSLLIFVFGMGIFMFLTGGHKLISVNTINYSKILGLFILALVTSIVEEALGRGFVFNQLYFYSRNLLMSLFVSALLFFVLYLPGALTAQIGGQALVMNLMLNFLLSFITGVLFYMRRNLLSAIGFHVAILLWFDLLLSPAF